MSNIGGACPTCGSRTHGIEELTRFPNGDGVGFYEPDVEAAIERMARGMAIAQGWDWDYRNGQGLREPFRKMARAALEALYA